MKDWIVMDARDQTFKCLHCGATWPLNLPASVSDICARSKAFEEEHGDCEQRLDESCAQQVAADKEPKP